jgi:DinB superfamily/Pentapeptide repeats (8 copies)
VAATAAPEGSSPKEFTDADLRGARFTRVDLSDSVMRAVNLDGADLDAPWLLEGDASLWVNGVDVAPLVEAELNRRMPGRDLRRAGGPEGLRTAWAAVEGAWASALDRVATMPPGTVDVSVDGEWSFSQTLRHLVMATDTWLGRAILQIPQPFHPLGQPHVEYETDGYDMSVFATGIPDYAEVLAARADRVAMVRDFLADVTLDDLDQQRRNPWDPDHPETVRTCLQVILEEEWEHLRFGLRDLDTIDRRVADAGTVTGG